MGAGREELFEGKGLEVRGKKRRGMVEWDEGVATSKQKRVAVGKGQVKLG